MIKISFVSWGANSTMFVKELRAPVHIGGAETTFKDTRILTKKRFFEKLSKDCQLENPRDRFRVNFFAGCWHVLNAVVNALRISAEHNCMVCFHVCFRSSSQLYLILICKIKLHNWKRSTAMTFRLICIDNCWRLDPVPALSSIKPRILKTNWMSSWVWKCLCVSQTWSRRRPTRYFWLFPWAWQRTQLLKAQAAEDNNICEQIGLCLRIGCLT